MSSSNVLFTRPWGTMRRLLSADYEIWHGIGRAGGFTSMHAHPCHEQVLTVTRGSLKIAGLITPKQGPEVIATLNRGETFIVGTNVYHTLYFLEPTTFVETYLPTPAKFGDVWNTKCSVDGYACDRFWSDTLSAGAKP